MIGSIGRAAIPVLLAVAMGLGSMAWAADHLETETFTVDNMTCGLCPITVRKAMEGVEGVHSVTVDFADKTATVEFDAAATSAAAIAEASRDAGYPAQAKDE